MSHPSNSQQPRLRGGGGGAGGSMIFFCDIAVDQNTKTRDRTFEGVPDPNLPPVPVVQPRPYLVPFWPNYAKSSEYNQNQIFLGP